MRAWTDYPFIELGDTPGQEAPIREVTAIAYDGDKYVSVITHNMVLTVKAGYLYTQPGRSGEVGAISRAKLSSLAK